MKRATYTARWIFPVAGPPLERGTITITGETIEAVEAHGARMPDFDLGNVAIIPGLVNTHTHLDLSGARGRIPPTDPEHFCDWLMGVIEYRKTRTLELVQEDVRAGMDETLKYGTTLIGDITAEGSSYDVVVSTSIRCELFWEIIGISESMLSERVIRFSQVSGTSWFDIPDDIVQKLSTDNVRWRLSFHAPYSVNSLNARLLMGLNRRIAVHFAESPGELELLKNRSGPFVAFLQRLGVYEESAISRGIEEFVMPVLPTDHSDRQLVLIHANYVSANVLNAGRHHVVYCPRTHAAFNHPPHSFREFLARGVNVALGTDSLASNPDLDLLAEARCVRERYPDVPGETILRMATLNGAKALGWIDECGSFEPGKSADFVAIPLANIEADDPHDLIIGEATIDGPRRTMFRGEWREADASAKRC